MKILIADDESLARSTLRSMLQELPLELEMVEDATNGEELVERVQSWMPHVVFVDIQMPRLNGLEAIRKVKQLAPNTRWFILTGFSEFSYAQEALRMGVADYLLKPVDPEELQRVMSEVVSSQHRRLVAANSQFERDLASVFHGLSSMMQEESDSLLRRAHFLGTIFYCDSYLPETEKALRQSNVQRELQARIDELLTFDARFALFTLPGGELALVCAWEAGEIQGKKISSRCLQQVEQALVRHQDQYFCMTMLQTPVCGSYDELSEQFGWLLKFSGLRVIYGFGKKLYRKDLERYAANPQIVEMSTLLSRMSHSYREKMYVQYMHAVDQLIQMCSQGLDSDLKRCAANFLSHTLPCSLTHEQPLSLWKVELQRCGDTLLIQPKKDNSEIVTQVMAFVEQQYGSDISIAQIAETLHMTPNYLSTLFHKRVGTTFMKYLTKIRMLRAKELLANPEMHVQQVAEQVGYYSVRHFTRVFTAYFGYYPSEQRKRKAEESQ